MPTEIPKEQYPTLIDLINETYTDGVDSVQSGRVEDDGAIVAIATDENRVIAFQYTDSQVSFKLVNPDSVDTESEFAEADTVAIWSEQFRNQAGTLIDGWVGQIRDSLDGVSDLAEFAEGLLNLYPNLDGESLRRLASDAIVATSIAGAMEDLSEDGTIDDLEEPNENTD